MQSVIEVTDQSQQRETSLNPEDRRVLLISSLTLFLRRARHGYPVTAADLIHLAAYGDEPSSRARAPEGIAA